MVLDTQLLLGGKHNILSEKRNTHVATAITLVVKK